MSRSMRVVARLRRLPGDRSGLSLIEFGVALPVLLAIGGYGIELANFFLCNLRVSQYALDLADNASRVDKTVQLQEYDINDVLTGTYLSGKDMNLTTNGRVTLSSIEYVKQSWDNPNIPAKMRVHWQRCIGARGNRNVGKDPDAKEDGFDTKLLPAVPDNSGEDSTASTQGADAPDGYGDPVAVKAPQDGGAMYAEINYEYQPIFGSLYMKKRIIHYTASFVVRDTRDFAQVYNFSPTQQPISTCDLHNAKPQKVNVQLS